MRISLRFIVVRQSLKREREWNMYRYQYDKVGSKIGMNNVSVQSSRALNFPRVTETRFHCVYLRSVSATWMLLICCKTRFFFVAQQIVHLVYKVGPGLKFTLPGSKLTFSTNLFHQSASIHLDCLLGLYWTGLTLLNGFSFLVIYFLFYFGSCGRRVD